MIGLARDACSRHDILAAFGIKPSYPATGYGYIEAGTSFSEGIFEVDRFHEKHEEGVARSYIESGRCYWNSGIFMWRPSVFLEAFDRLLPDGTEPLRLMEESMASAEHGSVIEEEYPKMN